MPAAYDEAGLTYDTELPYKGIDLMASATKLRTEIRAALGASSGLQGLTNSYKNYLIDPQAVYKTSWTAASVTVTNSGLADSTGALTGSLVDDESASVAGYIQQAPFNAISGLNPTAAEYELYFELKPNTSNYSALEIITDDGAGHGTSLIGCGIDFTIPRLYTLSGLTFPTHSAVTALSNGWYGVLISSPILAFYSLTARLYPAVGPGPSIDQTATGSVYATRAMVTVYASPRPYLPDSSWQTPPHVFEGDVGLAGGRNHGRLPFVEVWVEQRFQQEAQEGGYLQSVARIRWHVGGSPTNTGTVLAALDSLMAVSIKDIRNMTDSVTGAPKYAFEGDTRISPPKVGPFGWQQDAEIDVGLEYDVSNFGYA